MVMLIMASLVFVAVLRQFSGKWPNIQDPCPDEVVHGLFYSTGIASLPNVLGWLSMEHLPAGWMGQGEGGRNGRQLPDQARRVVNAVWGASPQTLSNGRRS